MKRQLAVATLLAVSVFILTQCSNEKSDSASPAGGKQVNGGFESQVKWGEYLVTICGCNDCHTPKKMGPNGPEDDHSLMLSGHPAQMPAPDFDREEAAKKGLVVTQTFTAWTGPWGTTYAPNLTSDSTGIGSWKEEQFVKALRELKWMGIEGTRPIMPPMEFMPVTKMGDDELKAIFAYLKSTPAVKNIPPDAVLLPPPPPAN